MKRAGKAKLKGTRLVCPYHQWAYDANDGALLSARAVPLDALDRTALGLNKPIYARTSAYGHFGRAPEADGGFSWERTDLAGKLKSALA